MDNSEFLNLRQKEKTPLVKEALLRSGQNKVSAYGEGNNDIEFLSSAGKLDLPGSSSVFIPSEIVCGFV